MKRRRDLGLGLLVFCLAMLTSALFWALLPGEMGENQSSDYTNFYQPVAWNIASGEGITLDGETAVRYPPGFPLLLAGVFSLSRAAGLPETVALDAFRLLCAGLAAVLVYALARLVWPEYPALLAALAWLTYPFGLYVTKQPNSEVPFIPVLYGAMFLLWLALLRSPHRGALYFGAGALAGAAMLIRPAALGLGLVMAGLVFVVARRKVALRGRLWSAALVLVGNLLVVAPWEALVYARTGEVIPLSSGGALTIQDGLTFLAVPKEYRREVDIPDDVAAMMRRFHERRPEMRSLGGSAAVIADEARQEPVTFGKIVLIKAGRSWYGIDSRIFELPTIILQVFYLAVIGWGSWYAWRRGGALRTMMGGNWLIVLYFWAMTMLVVPLLRYMLPVMGLLMVAAPGAYFSARALWDRATSSPHPVVKNDY